MAGDVCNLYCHPIKGIGRCRVESTVLQAGQTMPDDRIWAVTHEASKFDEASPEWVSCSHFIRGAKAPGLQAIELTQNDGKYTLTSAPHGTFSFSPEDTEQHAGFINWLSGFIPENRAQPKALIKAPSRGLTDSAFPSISILSTASLAALSTAASQPVAMERFRGNIWLNGFQPWAEREWIGRTIRIGEAEVLIRENITRCMATTANPLSGEQDISTLKLLESNWGHMDFGIYGEVVKPGRVSLNDKAELL